MYIAAFDTVDFVEYVLIDGITGATEFFFQPFDFYILETIGVSGIVRESEFGHFRIVLIQSVLHRGSSMMNRRLRLSGNYFCI